MVRRTLLVWAGPIAVASAILALGHATLALAQEKRAVYADYGVDFAVQPDGRVIVTEDQQVDLRSGRFTTGYVDLDTRGASNLQVLEVGEPGQAYRPGRGEPYTYEVSRDRGRVTVRWWFPPTERARRQFRVRYALDGALRFYEGGDQLWWKAIRADRPLVEQAMVTVTLPAAVSVITRATAYRLPGDDQLPVERVDERTMRVRASDLPRGTELEVRAEWPHGLIPGTPSPFQRQLDQERAGEQAQIDAERAAAPQVALLNLVTGFLGLMVLLGGLFGLYWLWYSRGRDTPVLLPADYLAEPPSDLAPGLAGTLLDEQADLPDVLATLIDLARRGELRMEETVEPQLLGLFDRHDFVFHHTPQGSPLAPHEQQLVEAFFGAAPRRVLSELKDEFYRHLPALQQALYDAVVAAGLFDANPRRTRRRYLLLGVAGLLVSLLFGCGVLSLAATVPAVLFLPAAMAAVAVGLVLLARFMPRKTPMGAEAAVRWRAFRRYLADFERYRDLSQAQDIFDRYLPYAVAFGLDREWIAKFARVDARVPPWFAPAPWSGSWWPQSTGSGGDVPAGAGVPAETTMAGPSPGEDAGGGGLPDLQRTSEGLGRGLQSMSTSLSRLLTMAATVLPSSPQAEGGGHGGWSSGGWSGGGFSGGGGGGGGGGFG
jgi:uncharacterized membrane protein